jgi:hypothetical protein
MRFARQIAGQGYICVAPSSYHEFTGPEPLKYDVEDTDKGNVWKITKVRQVRLATFLSAVAGPYPFLDVQTSLSNCSENEFRNSRPMTRMLLSA